MEGDLSVARAKLLKIIRDRADNLMPGALKMRKLTEKFEAHRRRKLQVQTNNAGLKLILGWLDEIPGSSKQFDITAKKLISASRFVKYLDELTKYKKHKAA